MIRFAHVPSSHRTPWPAFKPLHLLAHSRNAVLLRKKDLCRSHTISPPDNSRTRDDRVRENQVPFTVCKSSIERSPTVGNVGFWSSRNVWARSGVNTFRCLVGCTSGDFATMWYLQSAYPDLSTIATMSGAMAAGITTSIILETTLLHWGKDHLPWKAAAKTATGMSMISMAAMEITENAVDYTLTGGTVDFQSTFFWAAATFSMTAGFLVSLPYNYYRLRAYNKSCH